MSELAAARRAAHALAMAPFAFQAACAARDLGVLAALAHTPESTGAVAQRLGLPLTSVTTLLEACLAIDLVREDAGLWHATTTGLVWLKDRQVAVDAAFAAEVCWSGLGALTASLATATPQGLRAHGPWTTVYAGLAQLPTRVRAAWDAYDHAHSDDAFPGAIRHLLASGPRRVLDVGANTGRFSAALLAADPTVTMTLCDHAAQLDQARQQVATHHARTCFVPGDLLDHTIPFPGAQDAVWMSQFLDCFAPSDVQALLLRARAALAPGGSVWVLEPCSDRQSEPAAAASLRLASLYFTAIANGVSRFYRSTELLAWAEVAGLRCTQSWDGLGTAHTLFRFTPV